MDTYAQPLPSANPLFLGGCRVQEPESLSGCVDNGVAYTDRIT